MLPWLTAHFEDARREFGADGWSYGLEKNTQVLQTFTRYLPAQGLSPRKLSPQELSPQKLSPQKLSPQKLFAPESLEAFKI